MSKYVGDRETRIYHLNEPPAKQCIRVTDIDLADALSFNTRADAERAGYKPCDLCILRPSKQPFDRRK
jgi:hypothetical protein